MLHTEHKAEIELFKKELAQAKKEFEKATTGDAGKHYFAQQDKNYQGSEW